MENNFDFVISEFEKIKNKRNEVNISEINEMVDVLLKFSKSVDETLIIKLCKNLGFKVYEEDLGFNKLGILLVGDKALKIYGNERVFVVNKFFDSYYKRWYLAYLLGYYFLIYRNTFCPSNLEFYLTKYSAIDEFKARLIRCFVFNLMMPKEVFNKQFKVANSFNNRMCSYIYLSKFFQVPVEEVEKYIKYTTSGIL